MKRVAIMQPYFFPYLGYWQLVNFVDVFVVYDDVNYINRGWINRNRLLINGAPVFITLPLNQASQNKKICQIEIQPTTEWLVKLRRMILVTYANAAFFKVVFPVVDEILGYDSHNLADYLLNQLVKLASFMKIKTDFVVSSRGYGNTALSATERIIDICLRENATHYINLSGGKSLYEINDFSRQGISLQFITMRIEPYSQRGVGFVPFLSIIDTLMEIGPEKTKQCLGCFDFV